jgi:hypothetical protein
MPNVAMAKAAMKAKKAKADAQAKKDKEKADKEPKEGEEGYKLKEEPPVILETLPWLCPQPRAAFFLWYPGPTIMGHKMHWTEWIFVILLAGSRPPAPAVIMLILGPDLIPTSVYAVMLIVAGVLGFIFIWGIAKFKSLADQASQLEKVAAANHTQVGVLEDLNKGWDEGLNESQANLEQFADSLGLMEGSANDLDDLSNVLSGLVQQKWKIQAEEKGCFEVSIKHQLATRQEIEEKKRTLMKRKLMQIYKRLDKDGSGTLEGDEIDNLRQKLMEDTFLNLADEFTLEPRFQWLEEFEAVAEDGVVDMHELLNVLDKATNSYFLQVQFSVQKREELRKELTAMQLENGLEVKDITIKIQESEATARRLTVAAMTRGKGADGTEMKTRD